MVGFPDLAFLLFAVTHDAERLVAFAIQLSCERDSDRDAESLAERTGGGFDAGQFQPVRVALIG
jgi:hypothetical protein